jgi:hypothetical protein
MISAYKRQMGADYEKLHPEIQKRFDFSTDNNIAIVGKGIMENMWNGNKAAVFVLKLLSKRNILFPKAGKNIAYEIHNYPYRDQQNREVHSLNRIFFFPGEEQRFDGTALFSEKKNHIVEYLGLDHSMVFDMALSAEPGGVIKFTSGKQWAFIAGMKIPVPAFVRADIVLFEWYDDVQQRFYLDLSVRSKLLGPLFGFTGWFHVEYMDFTGKQIPKKFKPVRFEGRE